MIAPFLFLLAVSTASGTDGELLNREPYRFPFKSYAEWLKFMAKAPEPSQRPPAISEQISKREFDACVGQSAVVMERLTYRSDGLRVRAILARPRAAVRAPLVIFLHGGVAKWGKITTLDVLEFCHLVKQGFAVLAPTLRGEMGSEGQPNLGAGEVRDVLNALRLADSLPEIDTGRVALWGFSRGGGTAYRVLAKTDRFRLALIVAGPTDLVGSVRREEFHRHVYPGVVDGYEKDPDAALKKLSALYWPEKIAKSARIVIIHGTDDERVQVRHSTKMVEALRRTNRRAELLLIPGAKHSLRGYWSTVRTRMQTALRELLE